MNDQSITHSHKHLSRRRFLHDIGGTGLAGAAMGAFPSLVLPSKSRAQDDGFPQRPNLLFLITDQQRYPQHWPEDWIDRNLPNLNRLTKNGISFTRCYCNSAMCSPSRATLLTGLYPAHHGVVDTLTESENFEYNYLPLGMQNMARMLASAGYQVVYKGKWHLSKGRDQYDPTPEELAAYGFYDWNPPDAGQDGAPENFGSRHDDRFASEAAAFLQTKTPENTQDKPFALFVSIVNPHDVIGYPAQYQEDYPSVDGLDLGIELPETINEDLSDKPSVQKVLLRMTDLFLGKLITPQQRKTYVNFYAYLYQLADRSIGQVLDVLENQGLVDSTVVIQLSDHGEMGLSHGGMRQKAFVVYEEALRVPLLISNPRLFPQPIETDALTSLIDLMPTVASIANVPNRNQWTFRGCDLSPIFLDPSVNVQDYILFTFDDQRAGGEVSEDPMPQPNHIRAIIGKECKFARYFDPNDPNNVEYEMYSLVNDPNEVVNLAYQEAFAEKSAFLRSQLDTISNQRLAPIETSSSVKEWSRLRS